MRNRSTKPYWLTVKFAGRECSHCKKKMTVGVRAFYYPQDKTMLCMNDDCGLKASRELDADDFDQAQYESQY